MTLTKGSKKEIRNIAQDEIVDAMANAIQPMMDRLEESLSNKIDQKIDKLSQDISDFKQETKNNFMDVRRQISDLKIDTPTKSEFADHEKRIYRLEKHLSFA